MPIDVDTLRRLNARGLSLRAAAAQLGIAPSAASKASSDAVPPIVWDRTQTRRATQARVADARARRAELHARALDQLAAAMDDLDAMRAGRPYRTLRRVMGGGEEVVDVTEGAVIQDLREATAVVREATTVEKNLVPRDDTATAEVGKSLVGNLMDALHSARARD